MSRSAPASARRWWRSSPARCRSASAEVLDYPNLELVLSCSTGTDHLDVARRCRHADCGPQHADVLHRGGRRPRARVRAGRVARAVAARSRRACRGVGAGDDAAPLRRAATRDHRPWADRRRAGAKALALGIEVVGFDPCASAAGRRAVAGRLRRVAVELGCRLAARPRRARARRRCSAPPELALMRPDARAASTWRVRRSSTSTRSSRRWRRGLLGRRRVRRVAERAAGARRSRLHAPALLVTPHVGWSSRQADLAYVAEAIQALRRRCAAVVESRRARTSL